VDSFLQFCPKARQLRKLALQFRAMLRWRKAERLKAWMEKAVASGFFFLVQMYGRAGFDLLKARVLPWDPS
jgi:hypothetical protein